jgi:uncharacterized protein YbcI
MKAARVSEDGVTTEQIEDEISREILRVHEDSYGCGADAVVTRLLDDMVIVVLDDVEITQAERTLLDSGRSEAVRQSREAFQGAIGPTFKAVVERATGRRVGSFMSHMNIDPLYSVEFFRLVPSDTQLSSA